LAFFEIITPEENILNATQKRGILQKNIQQISQFQRTIISIIFLFSSYISQDSKKELS
jgi:hypothetical protein